MRSNPVVSLLFSRWPALSISGTIGSFISETGSAPALNCHRARWPRHERYRRTLPRASLIGMSRGLVCTGKAGEDLSELKHEAVDACRREPFAPPGPLPPKQMSHRRPACAVVIGRPELSRRQRVGDVQPTCGMMACRDHPAWAFLKGAACRLGGVVGASVIMFMDQRMVRAS